MAFVCDNEVERVNSLEGGNGFMEDDDTDGSLDSVVIRNVKDGTFDINGNGIGQCSTA